MEKNHLTSYAGTFPNRNLGVSQNQAGWQHRHPAQTKGAYKMKSKPVYIFRVANMITKELQESVKKQLDEGVVVIDHKLHFVACTDTIEIKEGERYPLFIADIPPPYSPPLYTPYYTTKSEKGSIWDRGLWILPNAISVVAIIISLIIMLR